MGYHTVKCCKPEPVIKHLQRCISLGEFVYEAFDVFGLYQSGSLFLFQLRKRRSQSLISTHIAVVMFYIGFLILCAM